MARKPTYEVKPNPDTEEGGFIIVNRRVGYEVEQFATEGRAKATAAAWNHIDSQEDTDEEPPPADPPADPPDPKAPKLKSPPPPKDAPAPDPGKGDPPPGGDPKPKRRSRWWPEDEEAGE